MFRAGVDHTEPGWGLTGVNGPPDGVKGTHMVVKDLYVGLKKGLHGERGPPTEMNLSKNTGE